MLYDLGLSKAKLNRFDVYRCKNFLILLFEWISGLTSDARVIAIIVIGGVFT